MFTARLTGLQPLERYFYSCGSSQTGYSRRYSFFSAPAHAQSEVPLTFAVVGDIGADPVAQNVRDDMLNYLQANGGGSESLNFFLQIGYGFGLKCGVCLA